MTGQHVTGTVAFDGFVARHFPAFTFPIEPDDSLWMPAAWLGSVTLRFRFGAARVSKRVRAKATEFAARGIGHWRDETPLTVEESRVVFETMEADMRRLISRHGISPPEVIEWVIEHHDAPLGVHPDRSVDAAELLRDPAEVTRGAGHRLGGRFEAFSDGVGNGGGQLGVDVTVDAAAAEGPAHGPTATPGASSAFAHHGSRTDHEARMA